MMRRWFIAWALVVGWVGVGSSAEPFYVDYRAVVPAAPLQVHALSIVHPEAQVDLEAAHSVGNRVLAYLSIGEIAADASYRPEAVERGLRLRGENKVWNSDVLDLSDKRWSDLLVDRVAAAAMEQGFDGFFLDTLDSVTVEDRPDCIALVRRLRQLYPDSLIIANRGFDMVPELTKEVDGVMAESVFGTFDFERKIYRPVPAEETAALSDRLADLAELGFEILVLDYADPLDEASARAIADRIAAAGWSAFVSTPDLQGTALAPWRQVKRRVFSFLGNMASDPVERVSWPVESFTGLRLQTPLEWLGYEVDYGKVVPGVSLPVLSHETAAVILPRGWEFPMTEERRVVDWLIEQKKQGRQILMFGRLPFQDSTQRTRFMEALELAGSGGQVFPISGLKEVAADHSILAGTEASSRLLPTGFQDLQAPAAAQLIRSITGLSDSGEKIRMDAVFTAEWGGAALDPYAIFVRPDFREFWLFDVFAFLHQALGPVRAPLPDATTRTGRRMFLSHIDGDGFINRSETDIGKFSAEVVRDEILKKYPVPVTVSVIEAEVTADVVGLDSNLRPQFEAIARDIFTLPNVQLASHSYSHPFTWVEGDRTSYLYEQLNLPLKTPYPKVDLSREIAGSVDYINRVLAPPGKSVEVFLWTGNCRPPPEALRQVEELGIVSMNGGDTLISRRVPTINAVAPRTIPWGDELQVFAPAQNENVFTNDWQGPHFGTFVNVIETFERTESPRRLKPVNIYYHFYSADFFASLHALKVIHDWAMEQPLHAVTVKAYVEMARGVREAEIYQNGENRWRVATRGHVRTFRGAEDWAERIDLSKSSGVVGWVTYQGNTYIHTDGGTVTEVVLSPPGVAPLRRAYLESSTGPIEFQGPGEQAVLQFEVDDLRPVEVILAGMPREAAIEVAINGESRSVESSEAGRIVLMLPSKAGVQVSWN